MRRVISLFRQLEDEYALPRLSDDDAESAPAAPELANDEAREPPYFVELLAYLRNQKQQTAEESELIGRS